MEKLGDINGTTRLQKYMDFSKFVDLINTKNIFLSKASCFEDKTEGSLSLAFEILHNGFAEILDNALCNVFPTIDAPTEEERKNKKKIQDEFDSNYDNRSYPTPFGQLYEKEINFDDYVSKHREWIDVTCWHAEQNKKENMAMWKIYGGAHNSVCILTDVNRLERNIVTPENNKLTIAKVEYISHLADEFKYEHVLAPFTHKSGFYEYEKEVRIIGYSPNRNLAENRVDSGTTIKIIDINDLIEEIRVSPFAPDWFFELVKSICHKYSLSIPVNRSQIHGTV
ncbi:hypothetical protein [Dryocola sp. BD613]|uniref:hypothetical protein n=1 Tax=Dryocola sp. BD613 TaxID=3133272 RepID=UPI003F50C1AD